VESQDLTQATIMILAAYLPYLWHDNVPLTGDQKRWQAARSLWQTLRPALDALPGGAHIVWSAVEGTDEQRGHLADDLLYLFEQNAELRSEMSSILSSGPFAKVVRGVASHPADSAPQSELLRRAIHYPILADDTPPVRQSTAFMGALLSVMVVGTMIGMLDYVTTFMLGELLGDTNSTASVLVSWMPFMAMGFLGGWLLHRSLIRALMHSRTHQRPLALSLAMIASMVLVYAIPTGWVWMEVLMTGPLLQLFDTPLDTLRAISWVFTAGGASLLRELADYGGFAEVSYLVVLGAMLLIYTISSLDLTGKIANLHQARRKRLERIGQPARRWSVGSGWLSYMLAIGLFVLLFWFSLYHPIDQPGDPGGPFAHADSEGE
jgi:hypothetical protein